MVLDHQEEHGSQWAAIQSIAAKIGCSGESQARSGIGSWIDYYNRKRPHSSFGGRTPDEVYAMAEMTELLAA